MDTLITHGNRLSKPPDLSAYHCVSCTSPVFAEHGPSLQPDVREDLITVSGI